MGFTSFFKSKDGSLHKTTVIFAALLLISTIVFVALSAEIMRGEKFWFDHHILRSLRETTDSKVPIGPSFLLASMRDISALGGSTVIIFIAIVGTGYLAITKKIRMLAFFLVSIFGATVAMTALKSFFARPRPDIVPFLTTVTAASFPSGHSMLSAVVYLTIGAILAKATKNSALKIYYMVIAAVLSGLIGISRVYLGVHYPTDVIAGWCAGIVWASLSYLVAQVLERKNVVEKATDPSSE